MKSGVKMQCILWREFESRHLYFTTTMKKDLHLDIETFSSVDIKSAGVYKYVESDDFEILMIAYCFGNGDINIVDLKLGEEIPDELHEALLNPSIKKKAHNATFERLCFRKYGYDVPIKEWECSMVKSAYCGLPLGLGQVSEALKLGDKGKKETGRKLISFFCVPIKPTKSNGMRTRNLPKHDPEAWEEFKVYCIYDVEAERAIDNMLSPYKIPKSERINYIIDQKINDRGVMIDSQMAQTLYDLDEKYKASIYQEMKDITGVENPNSPAQLKKWLSEAMGKEITSLAKDKLDPLIEEAESEDVRKIIDYRKRTSKTSTSKYGTMLNCVCNDERVHGAFQFYGAMRTGRWAGRLVQLQNLKKNNLSDLDLARDTFIEGDYELITMMYNQVASIISQLVRTAFVAKQGYTFSVADFSAIEARVVAWLANEKWRLDVFSDHGKIYEASASRMFNVPIEQVTKGSDLRAKGKNAELALGYQGSVGAMLRLGADKMGMTESEMLSIVKKWRKANPAIVQLWYDCEKYAKRAMIRKDYVETPFRGLAFSYDGLILKAHLPSGRHLSYYSPKFYTNRYGTKAIQYKALDQKTKKWWYTDTYGGKLVENIVQAISRDVLADSMRRLDKNGFDIVMHIHDEAICEIRKENEEEKLEKMCSIMGEDIEWAEGLPLKAEGYLTDYYKKDD